MSEPRMIKVVAFNNILNWSFVKLKDSVEHLNEIFEMVPEEFKNSANMSTTQFAKTGAMGVLVTYKRLETPAEVEARDLADAEVEESNRIKKVAELMELAEQHPDILQVKPEVLEEVAQKIAKVKVKI